jgi:hypothetical protein
VPTTPLTLQLTAAQDLEAPLSDRAWHESLRTLETVAVMVTRAAHDPGPQEEQPSPDRKAIDRVAKGFTTESMGQRSRIGNACERTPNGRPRMRYWTSAGLRV